MPNMKKALLMLAVLVFLAFPFQSLADIQMTYQTDASATSVMLMDDDGNVLSTVLNKETNGNYIDWTLNIITGGSDAGYFYTKDASGNWIRGNNISGLSSIADSTSTPPPSSPPDKPWPVITYTRQSISVQPLADDQRVQSRCGPAKTYHGAGAYKTYKMLSTDALFVEGNYVFVDMDYLTVGMRIVYFPVNAFYSFNNVPEVSLTSVSAYTTATLTPTFGPGYAYDTFDEAAISSGASLSVFFEENGWVFAEFNSSLGVVRAWIPVDQVGY
jgi:hypothetical protein